MPKLNCKLYDELKSNVPTGFVENYRTERLGPETNLKKKKKKKKKTESNF